MVVFEAGLAESSFHVAQLGGGKQLAAHEKGLGRGRLLGEQPGQAHRDDRQRQCRHETRLRRHGFDELGQPSNALVQQVHPWNLARRKPSVARACESTAG